MRADLSRLRISSESFQDTYKKDWALKRHRAAPLVQGRELFLTYLLRIGVKKAAVQAVATDLLRAVRVVRLEDIYTLEPQSASGVVGFASLLPHPPP